MIIKNKEISNRNNDFAKWYTDICKKTKLMDYSSVKGFIIYRNYSYEIWEKIKEYLNKKLQKNNHKNVYMPLVIPESLFKKEQDHIKGFAPETLIANIAGKEIIHEKLIIRPTSEALFTEFFSRIISTYHDLPKLYNQWCSVVRLEKNTRPFLRGNEFLWQEGHTMHETAQEAQEETLKMLQVYADFYKETLAIPFVYGKKTEKEKFAGALETYTIEPMMHNGVALQGGTSHYFGDGFAKSFDIQFQGRDNKLHYPHQTSWGTSTRMMGALIMVHSDDDGLVLPPKVAPIQLVIVPIATHKEGVLDKATELYNSLKGKVRVKLDDTDQSPGWKFAQYEMKGVPIRLEIGPKDIEKNQCVLVRRDTREKMFVSLDELDNTVEKLLVSIHNDMYQRAYENMIEKTHIATTYDEFCEIAKAEGGFIKAMWCGDSACEEKIKDDTNGVKSRCIPFEEEHLSDKCVCCGKEAKHMVYWGKQY